MSPIYQLHSSRVCSLALTLFPVVDDVLAEQVIVAQHHWGAQGGQVLLHPPHLLLQHLLAGNLLLDSEAGRKTQELRTKRPKHFVATNRKKKKNKVSIEIFKKVNLSVCKQIILAEVCLNLRLVAIGFHVIEA